jgi:hypothetical protein
VAKYKENQEAYAEDNKIGELLEWHFFSLRCVQGHLGNIVALRYVQKRVCTRGAAQVKNFSMMHDLLASFEQKTK